MRPLRSLSIGDCDHYLSPYLLGVAQAMRRLGHEHRSVSIRQPIAALARAIDETRPDVLWTHMLLWPPPGSPTVEHLVALMEYAARKGARIVIHDGDYKERVRHPHDLSRWCSLALVNHGFSRAPWKVPVLRWPYFAMHQDRIADVDPYWRCDLFFAGSTAKSTTYAARSALLERLQRKVKLRTPDPRDGNTLLATPVIAASADAVLGFGRPGVDGWVDTRVFQYPGAGAILLHDDAAGYLEPWRHFVPYRSGDPDSAIEALRALRLLTDAERRAMRERAFAFVQERHNSVARVRQVLDALGLGARRAA